MWCNLFLRGVLKSRGHFLVNQKHDLRQVGFKSTASLGMAQRCLHDADKHMFYISLVEKDGNMDKAMIQYHVQDGVMDMYHTFIPTNFRGKGIGKELAKGSMDYAVAKNLRMRLSCTYLQKYLRDNPHPVFQKHVVD